MGVPAYEAMRASEGLGPRLLETLLRGVSTHQYGAVLPAMAETVGVLRPAVSQEAVEASEEERMCERRFDDLDLLLIYLDGVRFGEHHVLVAIAVDAGGRKHVLGLAEGASENQVVAKGLLEDLVRRGVKPDRRSLFVIDGSKALRAAIDAVFGKQNPVQRCRRHKIKNVRGYLPDHLKDQVKAAMRAAYRPEFSGRDGKAGEAGWLELEFPSAAASLWEGLAEMFTVNRLGLSGSLVRCLSSTNVIESPNSGMRLRRRRVCRWRDGSIVLRWAAAALSMTEKHFRKIMGYRDLWMLKAALQGNQTTRHREVA